MNQSNDNPLITQREGGVVSLTLNQPESYNTLSEGMLSALQTALDEVAADASARVVILGAAGKGFCAGHNLKEMRARPDQDYYGTLFRACSRMMKTIVEMPQPVIAKVQGIATAAGCQLVATCDMAVAEENARFATNGIANGLFCSTPSVALSRNVPRKKAFEMLFTGDFVGAEESKQIGLVNLVVPLAELDKATQTLAQKVADKSNAATRSGKSMFYKQLGMDLNDAYEFAAENMACDMMSDDAGEGIDAFIEKRKPVWKDR
jgi:enoyl-CoA hydratase/carnithine racemase